MGQSQTVLNLKKKELIGKDFKNIEKLLLGEKLPKRVLNSNKLKTLAQAVVAYSIKYWEPACVKTYQIYSIKPWLPKDQLVITEAKRLIREKSKLYLTTKKNNSLFLEQFHSIAKPQRK